MEVGVEIHPSVLKVALLSDDDGLADALAQATGSVHAVQFKEGHTYDGQWHQGCMHGSGAVRFPDGVMYSGQFQQNAITGQGEYQWEDASYQGGVKDGRRHGYGRMSFSGTPVTYEGEWQNGMRHGMGSLYFNEERTCYYKGQWENDMKHGQGTMAYASGNTYSGMWSEDRKCGPGTMTWASRDESYTGEWHDDQPNGVGEHVWLALSKSRPGTNHGTILMYNRYQGMFRDGKREGEGVLHYASGARYEGQWHQDLKHGEGAFLFEDGTAFLGTFTNDRPVAGSSSPGGASFGPKGPHVKVRIDDLLQDEQAPEKVLKAVLNVLMCYNSDLRSLYDKYCKRTPSHGGVPPSRRTFSMLSSQFWELACEALLVGTALPLVEVSQALMRARAPPADVQKRRTEVLGTHNASGVLQDLAPIHHPHSELLYRDFCEALVRLAALRYQQLPSLEARVQHVVTGHLLPLNSRRGHVQMAMPRSVLAMRAADDTDVREVLQAADEKLRGSFLEVAGAGEGDDVYDWEVTARGVLRRLVHCGIADEAQQGKLPLAVAVAALRDACQLGGAAAPQRVRMDSAGAEGADHSEVASVAASMAPTELDALCSMAACAAEEASDDEDAGEANLAVAMCVLDADMMYCQYVLALVLCAKALTSANSRLADVLQRLLEQL